MTAAEVIDEAILEGIVFLDDFSILPDPRQLIKVIYPLDEILLLSLLAVVAEAETFTGIAEFGRLKLPLLRRFRPSAHRTIDHDSILPSMALPFPTRVIQKTASSLG